MHTGENTEVRSYVYEPLNKPGIKINKVGTRRLCPNSVLIVMSSECVPTARRASSATKSGPPIRHIGETVKVNDLSNIKQDYAQYTL